MCSIAESPPLYASAAKTRLSPVPQLLISGGKRGNVCIFDVRRRQVRHRFTAHEAAIKCMALDPAEEYFVTGSDEGDIKVSWGTGTVGRRRSCRFAYVLE